MQRISESLRELVLANPFLRYGLSERLLNLSQVARFLRPLIAARTNKELQDSGIVMGLSRLQRELEGTITREATEEGFQIRNLSIHSDLHIVTFNKTRDIHRALQGIYVKVIDQGGFMTITEGGSEVTVIVEEKSTALLERLAGQTVIHRQEKIASLALKFDDSYLQTPGLLHFIFQQLYFQNINILEIASTRTELIVYLAQPDLRLAFDSIYQRFVVRPLDLRI